MTYQEAKDFGDYDDVIVFNCPSYEDAFIGISNDDRAVYSYDKIIESIMKEMNISLDEARDFIWTDTMCSLNSIPRAPIIVF